MALAGVFAHLIHMGEYGIEGLERFLNAMAQPFTGDIPELGGPLPTKDQLEGFAEPFLSLDLWHVCQYLVDGIKKSLEVQIGMWTTIELAYMKRDGYSDDFVGDLRRKRHQLKQGFGLLSTLGTNSPLGGISNVNVDGTSGNVFLGGPEGAGFNLSLTDYIFQLQFTPLPSINNPPEGFLLGDSLPGLYLNWNDPHRLILVDMPRPQTVKIPQVIPSNNPDGTKGPYAASHMVRSGHAEQSSLHSPTNYSIQTLNNFAGFALGVIGEVRLPGLSTIIGSQYMFNQMMTAENRMLQAIGEYICAVQSSLDAMLQRSLDASNVAYFHLDLIEVHDAYDSSIKEIFMPTPMTIEILELLR